VAAHKSPGARLEATTGGGIIDAVSAPPGDGIGTYSWVKIGTTIALIVLCVEVEENPATRDHLWILAGMVLLSLGIELAYRCITGRKMRLVQKPGT